LLWNPDAALKSPNALLPLSSAALKCPNALLFAPDAKLLQITKAYSQANAAIDEDVLFSTLERLRKIINNHVGLIELAEDLDIETVTEIFIRVNSAGAKLSQADFAMSKIAANESYGGNVLRKLSITSPPRLRPSF
jgi:hypothetical protein